MNRFSLLLFILLSMSLPTPCLPQSSSEQSSTNSLEQEQQKKEMSSAKTSSIIPFIKEHGNLLTLLGGSTSLCSMLFYFLKKPSKIKSEKSASLPIQKSDVKDHEPAKAKTDSSALDVQQPSSHRELSLQPQQDLRNVMTVFNRLLMYIAALLLIFKPRTSFL